MDRFKLLFCGSLVAYDKVIVFVEIHTPQFTQEAVTTVDTVCVPGFRLLYRSQEHFVHTQCIGTIFLYNYIGIHYVVHRLTHLFDCPSADVFVVLENKLCIGIFGTPSSECINVENIVCYNIYIDVYWCNIVIL